MTKNRPFILLLAIIAGALSLAACGGNATDPRDSEGRIKVVATTVQIGALAREIGGDRIALTVLMGPGVDPHDYELTADARKDVAAAGVILRNGVGLDAFLDGVLKSKDNQGKLTTVSEGVAIHDVHETSDHKEDDGHAHEDGDPHIWHDPANVKIMVDNIASALAKADETNAEAYRANAEKYKATLDETDAEIRKLIGTIPPANRKMVTNHDAFGYFIDAYGLEFVGAVIPGASTQSEPSAKDIAALVELIKREQVKAIFSESTVDPKVATQVARDTNVKIVDNLYGDSLGDPGTPEATIHGMLLFNARLISEALK